jgi:hypothetical protein
MLVTIWQSTWHKTPEDLAFHSFFFSNKSYITNGSKQAEQNTQANKVKKYAAETGSYRNPPPKIKILTSKILM